MSTTPRRPRNKLILSTPDPVASQAVIARQMRDGTVHSAPRTAVLSARVSLAAREQIAALARRRATTPSKVLAGLVVTLAESDITEPSREQVEALAAVCRALEIPVHSDADAIRAALGALLDGAPQPEPVGDPLEGAAEPAPPAQLSRGTAQRAPATGRTFTTSRGVVTLSASELAACKEAGAKPEAYAENKALRDKARRPARAASDPLRVVQTNRRAQARRR